MNMPRLGSSRVRVETFAKCAANGVYKSASSKVNMATWGSTRKMQSPVEVPCMRRLLIATTNPGKLREITAALSDVPFQLVTLAEWPLIVAPEETGRTFEENARAKALYYAARTGELTVAEDSGLEIDALGGAPGIASARWGGADATYPQKFALIYETLRAKGRIESPARFICALALARNGAILFETRGIVEGRVAPEPKGGAGFGYDPIFFYPPFGRTLAELGDRKHAVSHRGAAFRALKKYLLNTDN